MSNKKCSLYISTEMSSLVMCAQKPMKESVGVTCWSSTHLFIKHVTSNKFTILTVVCDVYQHNSRGSSSNSYQQIQQKREHVMH